MRTDSRFNPRLSLANVTPVEGEGKDFGEQFPDRVDKSDLSHLTGIRYRLITELIRALCAEKWLIQSLASPAKGFWKWKLMGKSSVPDRVGRTDLAR